MRALRWLVMGLLLVAGAGACGDDQKPASPGDIFHGTGGSGGGDPLDSSAQSGFCSEYCAAIVANGTDCGHYNDDHRCEDICGFYRAGACADEYGAFATCMKGAAQVSCFLASSGKWGLDIYDCNTEYDAFNTCIEAKDAGVCPY